LDSRSTISESDGSDEDENERDEIEDAWIESLHAEFATAMALANDEIAPQDPDVIDDTANLTTNPTSLLENIRITQNFIDEIKHATLENGKTEPSVTERLRTPDEESIDISDPDTKLSLNLFLAMEHASEAVYNAVRDAIHIHSPKIEILSLHSVKKLVANITGVIAVPDDMCFNSCLAFTGPFSHLQACPVCGEPRYDPIQLNLKRKNIPRKEQCTILLGPQIQALRRSETSAREAKYRDEKTQEILKVLEELTNDDDFVYDDILCGSQYINLANELRLTDDDTVVCLSLDGAQLYQNKKSDTWIAIWIILEYNPSTRYKKKHVLPCCVIPGPNKPKNLDSFLFRSLHHVSALQRENNGAGLQVFNGLKKSVVSSRIIVALATADALGLVEIDGRVGHHGAQGCRLGCNMKGRHKPGSGHYYAAHLRPNENLIEDNNHPDVDLRTITPASPAIYHQNLSKVINSVDQNEYERNRKLTGISKPSILSGLNSKFMFPIPLCFTVDLMHLLCINLGELLIPLWRGILKCESTDDKSSWDWAKLTGDKWTQHGQQVAAATPFFPSFFHRPPRNPAEKINSGYKATEYYLYLFGLGPAVFRTILPRKYWRNFCKLVRGVRILIQRRITSSQVRDAHSYLVQFVEEFENLYYQRRTDRLSFGRPCLHTLGAHSAVEIPRVGPGAYSSQFTMERAIGDLGQEIRQPSNPFGNLCAITVRRSQQNALKALYPELDRTITPNIPKYANNLGNGFVLLRPRERYFSTIPDEAGDILQNQLGISRVRRWGRVRLRNGQVARSLWSESKRFGMRIRNTRNIKVMLLVYLQ
jgi:hypothetical protein